MKKFSKNVKEREIFFFVKIEKLINSIKNALIIIITKEMCLEFKKKKIW